MSWQSFGFQTLQECTADKAETLRSLGRMSVLASDNSVEILKWIVAARTARRGLAIVAADPIGLGPLDGPVATQGDDWRLIGPDSKLLDELPTSAMIALQSSGSTGAPKWILRSWKSFHAEGQRYLDLFGEVQGTVATALPLHHAFGLGLVLGTLLHGAEIAVLPRFIPRLVARRLIEGHDWLHALTPATARLTALAENGSRVPDSQRRIIIGAGPLTGELAAQLSRFGGRLCRNYGSSETGALLATDGIKDCADATGFPMPGAQLQIDDNRMLWCRTMPRFLGYLTEQGVDTRAVAPGGWYCLGDRARRDENGALTILGRADRRIKINDQLVDLAAVEAALRRCPGVQDCIARTQEDRNGRLELVADLEPVEGADLQIAKIAQFCREQLPTATRPVVFTVHGALPRTAVGKPDLQRLATPQMPAIVAARHAAARLALTLTERARRSARHAALERVVGPTDSGSVWEQWWIANAGRPDHLAARLLDQVQPAKPDDEVMAAYKFEMGRVGRLLARRIVPHLAPGRVLELGLPGEVFLPVFSEAGIAAEGSISLHLDRPVDPVPSGGFDLLVLHNAIRRISLDGPARIIEHALARLNPQGSLIVSDIFADGDGDKTLVEALTIEWIEAGLAPFEKSDEIGNYVDVGISSLTPIGRVGLFGCYLGKKANE